MKTYRAEVYREGKWWMISVPEIDQMTQTQSTDSVEYMARDLIAVTLDVPIEDVAVEITRAPTPRVGESNNPQLPDPDSLDTTVLRKDDMAAVPPKKNEPRRAYKRERLLQREDWSILLILVGLAFSAGFLGGVLAIFLFT